MSYYNINACFLTDLFSERENFHIKFINLKKKYSETITIIT